MFGIHEYHQRHCITMDESVEAARVAAEMEAKEAVVQIIAATTIKSTTGSAAPICTICLGSNLDGQCAVPGGCACRGTGGFSHSACRIAAAHHLASVRGWNVWWKCDTCLHKYNGITSLEMVCGPANFLSLRAHRMCFFLALQTQMWAASSY